MERLEVMTVSDLIDWARMLSNGYAKPDLRVGESNSGTVRETKHFMPFIMLINEKLCKMAGIDCPSVTQFENFKTPRTRTNHG